MTSHVQPLSDPGGVRSVAARWVITADLVLESAAHIGGSAGDATDMVILRDAREGRPLLPGTSLAGALRSHLADVLGGYRSPEDSRVARLFGGARGDDLGSQSPLIVFDSLGELPGEHPVEIRDGVQIDAARGTAEEHKKFDFEVLPAGTRFPVRFELLVPEAGAEGELVGLLVASLKGLACGDIAFGARRSRGLGALRAENWRAIRYDMGSRQGWLEWLRSDPMNPIPGSVAPDKDPAEAFRRAHPSLEVTEYTDGRRRLIFDLVLQIKGGLLVRSAPVDPEAPDAVHLSSAGRSVLPGTSLMGVLRARALRIARIVRESAGDAAHWVDGIFGPRHEGVVREDSSSLWASRLRISEAPLSNSTRLRTSRVRIDRFTQGVVPGALFEEEPEHEGEVHIRLELRNPEPGEAGLLVLVLKDLLDGDLPVGGSSSVGRGVLRGEGTLIQEDGSQIRLNPEGCDSAAARRLDHLIQEFWKAELRRKGT